MGYRELIKKVQHYSGFSDKESKEALDHTVECLAVNLTEGERKDFASQLPEELKDIALSVYPTENRSTRDFLAQYIETGGPTEELRAKKQVLSAWKALKLAISKGEIADIRAQLSAKTVAFLK